VIKLFYEFNVDDAFRFASTQGIKAKEKGRAHFGKGGLCQVHITVHSKIQRFVKMVLTNPKTNHIL
jgi:hypothetical protein